MRYKLGDKKPRRQGANMLTLLNQMERERWYEVEELKQMAADSKLSDFTVHNLVGYGVQHGYVIRESEIIENTIPHSKESSFNPQDKPTKEQIATIFDKLWQDWQDNLAKKHQSEEKIANLEQEIEKLHRELEQEQQRFKNLCQELERSEESLKPFLNNSEEYSRVA